MFVGYVTLDGTLNSAYLVRDASRTPANADAAPGVRVYAPDGLVAAVTTAATFLDHGTVTGATNATPVAITSANHGLNTGAYVTVSGVVGITNANTTTTVTVVDANTFSLDGTTGNGTYTSGGVWNVAGLYTYAVVCSAANGFEAGVCYRALVTSTVSGVTVADTQEFIVV